MSGLSHAQYPAPPAPPDAQSAARDAAEREENARRRLGNRGQMVAPIGSAPTMYGRQQPGSVPLPPLPHGALLWALTDATWSPALVLQAVGYGETPGGRAVQPGEQQIEALVFESTGRKDGTLRPRRLTVLVHPSRESAAADEDRSVVHGSRI